jgi:hypothetical protein
MSDEPSFPGGLHGEKLESARPGQEGRGPGLPLADLVFLWWATLVPIGLSWGLFNMDGDLPRHLAAGEWMIEHRALLHHYPFSYLKPAETFLPFEWLSEVLFAGLYRVGGLAAVAVFSGLLIGLAYALLTRLLQRRGADPWLAVGVSLLSAMLGIMFWRARPLLFTLLGVVLLLSLLERPAGRRLWPYLPLFVLWSNLHGGFVFGWILIGAYGVGDLVEARRSEDPGAWLRLARDHAVALGLAFMGALLNPHGLKLIAHVVGFFGQRTVVDRTNEFLSPDFHTWHNQLFLLALLGLLAALAGSRRRLVWPRRLAILISTAFSLYSVRNIQLFGLIALPLAALHLDADWRHFRERMGLHWRVLSLPPWLFGRHEGIGILVGTLAMGILGLNGGRLGSIQVVANQFDPEVFPIAAVTHARAACLSGRLFNRLNWGGYIAHAWPRQPVFIDGATDFFGDSLFREYMQLSDLQPGWRALLARHGIALVMVPSNSALAHELARDVEWRLAYRDSTAAILRRWPPDLDSSSESRGGPQAPCVRS